jgi:hypothetical protein
MQLVEDIQQMLRKDERKDEEGKLFRQIQIILNFFLPLETRDKKEQ